MVGVVSFFSPCCASFACKICACTCKFCMQKPVWAFARLHALLLAGGERLVEFNKSLKHVVREERGKEEGNKKKSAGHLFLFPTVTIKRSLLTFIFPSYAFRE